MKRAATMPLLALATAMNGILAGAGLVRLLVDMPAWRRVGALAWADFSRHADLGNGLVLYPLLGVGGAVAAVGAAVTFRVRGATPGAAAAPIDVGALLALLGMVTTAFAAPQMLRLRAAVDAGAIQQAFERFELWGGIRAVTQALAVAAHVWAIARLSGGDRRTGP